MRFGESRVVPSSNPSNGPEGWLDGLFDPGRDWRPAIIRHEPEHLNHMHVRFYNPLAQRTGRLVHDIVAKGNRSGTDRRGPAAKAAAGRGVTAA